MSEPFTTFVENQSPATTPFTGAELLTLVQGGVSRQTPLSNIVIDAIVTGTIFYVSNSGNDASTGTSATNAWKTINKVNSSIFAPGTVVLFQGGQTFFGALISPSSGTAGAPITFGSYGGGQATISSGAVGGFSSTNQAGIIVRDLTFVGNGTTNAAHGVLFTNNAAGNVHYQNIQIINCTAQNYGWGGFLVIGTNGAAGYDDVFIDGCYSTGNSYNGNTAGIGNSFAGLGGFTVSTQTGYGYSSGLFPATFNGVRIQNCIAYNNPGTTSTTTFTGNGFSIGQINQFEIINCTAQSNGANALNSGGAGTGGFLLNDCNQGRLLACRAWFAKSLGHVDNFGFDLDGGVQNTVCVGCESKGNYGNGFILIGFNFGGITGANDSCSLINCTSYGDCANPSSTAIASMALDSSTAALTNANITGCRVYQTNANFSAFVIAGSGASAITGTVIGNTFAVNGTQAILNGAIPSGVTYTDNLNYRGNCLLLGAANKAASSSGFDILTVQSPLYGLASLNGTTANATLGFGLTQGAGDDTAGNGFAAFGIVGTSPDPSYGLDTTGSGRSSGDFVLQTFFSAAFKNIFYIPVGTRDPNFSGVVYAKGATANGSGVSVFHNPSPALELVGDQTVGAHDWQIGEQVVSGNSEFFIFDITGNHTIVSINLDGNGSAQLRSGALWGWSSNATNSDAGAMDTAISRIAPVSSVPTIAIGNGTAADASGTIKAKTTAGAPANTDVPAGTWALIRDTTNSTTKLYYNNAGTLMTVALT